LNLIVFDLEATCWRGFPPNGVNEIIEIGALKFNRYGEQNGDFSVFVKPIVNNLLSPFCKQLTGIQQENIDQAETFDKVISRFREWGEIFDEEFYLISWGENDKDYLRNDCNLHDIETDWLEKCINLKKQYRSINRHTKPMGLKRALELEGFEFEGSRHRAFDDAYNLSRIFLKYIDEWPFY
jgi:3'-5' exoribonuclease 1